MPKAGFIVTRVSFLVLAASMLGVAMLAVPAAGVTSCAPPSGKCFAVAVSPSNPVAGVSTSFMFTITNEASTQTLGSVQISAPAGATINGASLFLNLSLAPSASTTLTVSATMSTVSCSSNTYQWGIEAKQSNDFNGAGNDFQLDSNSTKNLTGSCSLQPCPDSTACSASASSATTSGTATISKPEPGDSITTGMESVSPPSSFNFSCGTTYQPVSDAFGFAVFNAGSQVSRLLIVTLRIDKSLVSSSGHPGASSWQICYASTQPFKDQAQPGTYNVGPPLVIGGVTYNTGLLLDCSNPAVAPCVQTRKKNNAGDVIVTFLAFGDPYGRG